MCGKVHIGDLWNNVFAVTILMYIYLRFWNTYIVQYISYALYSSILVQAIAFGAKRLREPTLIVNWLWQYWVKFESQEFPFMKLPVKYRIWSFSQGLNVWTCRRKKLYWFPEFLSSTKHVYFLAARYFQYFMCLHVIFSGFNHCWCGLFQDPDT